MSFSDDILIAYANGELDQATRHAVEAAVLRDAALAQRLAHFQSTRQRMAGPRRGANVVQLAAVRATRAATQQAARKARKRWRWSWLEWGVLAAVLGLGVVVGKFGLSAWQPDPQSQPSVAWRDGALLAQGRLGLALDQAPSGAGGVYGGSVRIAASFVALDGVYCRSFTTGGAPGAQELAGLACKSGGCGNCRCWCKARRRAPGRRGRNCRRRCRRWWSSAAAAPCSTRRPSSRPCSAPGCGDGLADYGCA